MMKWIISLMLLTLPMLGWSQSCGAETACHQSDTTCRKGDTACQQKVANCHQKGAACQKEGMTCEKKGTACGQKGTACQKEGMTCKKKGTACGQKSAACQKEGMTCEKKGTACHQKGTACHQKGTACQKESMTCEKKGTACGQGEGACHKDHALMRSSVNQGKADSLRQLFSRPYIRLPRHDSLDAKLYDPSTLIIHYDEKVGKRSLLKAAKKWGAKVVYTYSILPAVALRKPDKWTLDETIEKFKGVKGVLQVNRNRLYQLDKPQVEIQ